VNSFTDGIRTELNTGTEYTGSGPSTMIKTNERSDFISISILSAVLAKQC